MNDYFYSTVSSIINAFKKSVNFQFKGNKAMNTAVINIADEGMIYEK